jgi:hypothetical protein
MQTETVQFTGLPATSATYHLEPLFPPLEQVTRSVITTREAAYYLNRKAQTLRTWACFENGAICPIRINGRLAWPVAQIRALLNGGTK